MWPACSEVYCLLLSTSCFPAAGGFASTRACVSFSSLCCEIRKSLLLFNASEIRKSLLLFNASEIRKSLLLFNAISPDPESTEADMLHVQCAAKCSPNLQKTCNQTCSCCVLFVLNDGNVTKTNSSAHFYVIGE